MHTAHAACIDDIKTQKTNLTLVLVKWRFITDVFVVVVCLFVYIYSLRSLVNKT